MHSVVQQMGKKHIRYRSYWILQKISLIAYYGLTKVVFFTIVHLNTMLLLNPCLNSLYTYY